MEYVAGTDLSAVIRDRGRLTPDEAAPVLGQTASALAAAHGAGIVHRDVKPSNILVAPDGQVKLSDFGIARTAADPALTQTGLVTGSPAYISPEVASGQQATPASDVWSWGATLFHALEGRPPYQAGENVLGALYRIVHEEPPRADSAGWLEPVLAGTMTRDPAQRWPMSQVQQFLDRGPGRAPAVAPAGGRAAIGLGATRRTRSSPGDAGTRVLPASSTSTAPPPPPREASAPAPKGPRRSWVVVAAAALTVVVAMVVAFLIGMHGGNDDPGSADPSGRATAGPTTGSGTPSPSKSASAAAPTEEEMVSFVRDYIAEAVSDPASAYQMLTPAFQQQSNGLSGYQSFWDEVRSAKILSIAADPDAMEVSYRYRYVVPGGPAEDDVTLKLTYSDGSYQIAGES
jgi:serine/threonine protein kinase